MTPEEIEKVSLDEITKKVNGAISNVQNRSMSVRHLRGLIGLALRSYGESEYRRGVEKAIFEMGEHPCESGNDVIEVLADIMEKLQRSLDAGEGQK